LDGFLFGILGGIVAWISTAIIGQPFYELLKLRRETARLLHMYDPEIKDDRATISGWINERADAYRSCAAKLFAFDSSEMVAVAIAKMGAKRSRRISLGASTIGPRGIRTKRASF
jgi:hypothetical protein